MQEIKIGYEFFVYDINRRVYERDEKGHAIGAATFRGHFAKVIIVGETSRSWITDRYGMKVSKKDPFSILYTPEMIDDAEWIDRHAYHIGQLAGRSKDITALKKIAELISYKG